MASLFIFVGITQIQRVIARDWVMHVQVFFNSHLQLSLRTFACASLVHLCASLPSPSNALTSDVLWKCGKLIRFQNPG